jgi:acyl-CoA synthetase (AMP-forming)/AMP-acid ligase II
MEPLAPQQALAQRAADEPDRTAFVFLPDGTGDGEQCSYAQLDRRARSIAARLRERVPGRARVLLLCPPGLDYIAAFFGCLYAGVVAVPAYPPSPRTFERDLDRLRNVVASAAATAAVTTSEWIEVAQGMGLDSRAAVLDWICADDARVASAALPGPVEVADADLAYLQYTSGSTAEPKGVMVSHSNVRANQRMIRRPLALQEGKTVVSWLPPYHDMGLVGFVFGPVMWGQRSVLMPPEAFLRHPIRWPQTISRFRAYLSAAPDFAYDLAVRRSDPHTRAGLDLRCWQVAVNGSEPVRPAVIDRFVETFAPYGFRSEAMWPSYGLAEATLLVSAGRLGADARRVTADEKALATGAVVRAPAGRSLMSCGVPPPESGVRIIDPGTGATCPDGQVGEIEVRGESVCPGYWQAPRQSAEAFGIAGDDRMVRTVRTGDLGFLLGGELVITGRRKDLVIIRGRNHYPQDLEHSMASAHTALRPGCGAALAVPGNDGELLVLAQEIRPEQLDDPDEVIAAIRRVVATEHDVAADAVLLLAPQAIPKTSSGKIRRHKVGEAFAAGELETVHMWRSRRLAEAPRAGVSG